MEGADPLGNLNKAQTIRGPLEPHYKTLQQPGMDNKDVVRRTKKDQGGSRP